jgi:urease accessory protein
MTETFLSGYIHPILGFDHLLAMIAVGLLSVQMGGRAIWRVPAAFVLFLGIGGVVGLLGLPLPQVEGIIALSVFAIGLAIALRWHAATLVGAVFVAIFAVFHGHAHATDVPALENPVGYVAGFMAASATLHVIGVALGLLSGRPQARALLGAGCAGIGLHLLLLTYSVI